MTVERIPGWLDIENLPHQMKTLRRALYASTNGAGGVTRPLDLRVTTIGNGGNGVTVNGGSAVIPSNYPGGLGESYTFTNTGSQNVSVRSTTTAPRSDMIIARIDDPQMAGQSATAQDGYQYARLDVIEGVASGATEIQTDYPAIPLARIDLPVNANLVLKNMIHDVRRVANPLRETQIVTVNPGGDNTHGVRFAPKGALYRAVASTVVQVPTWATKVVVEANMNGVRFGLYSGILVAGVCVFATDNWNNGNIARQYLSENGILTQEAESNSWNLRQSVYMAGKLDVSAMRGKQIHIGMAGVLSTGGEVALDYQTAGTIKWTWLGEAA